MERRTKKYFMKMLELITITMILFFHSHGSSNLSRSQSWHHYGLEVTGLAVTFIIGMMYICKTEISDSMMRRYYFVGGSFFIINGGFQIRSSPSYGFYENPLMFAGILSLLVGFSYLVQALLSVIRNK